MEISKTMFKEYAKCENFPYLDSIYKLKSLHEDHENIGKILLRMFNEDGDDLINVPDEQMEIMLPYYQEVERLALKEAEIKFNKKFTYNKNTKDQKKFQFKDNFGNIFYTYVDGFCEEDEEITILEIKSTTNSKFLKNGNFSFQDGIITINDVSINDKKIFDRTSDIGKYLYDFAITKFIVNENALTDKSLRDKKINYYLGILNSKFIFNGKYINDEPDYFNEEYQERLFSFVKCNDLLNEYLLVIKKDYDNLINNINNKNLTSIYNEHCKNCEFEDICFENINSFFSIKTLLPPKKVGKENLVSLINNKYYKITDLNPNDFACENHLIEYNSIKNDEIFYDKEQIYSELDKIKYPIYHLDFESFFIPLPRYYGEKPYTQSVFQFSIHIEKEEGICDRYKDNYYYLPMDFLDHREELIKEMIKVIDLTNGGTVLVYNKNFEYTRIKEFIDIFPKYKKELENINNHMFDLMDVVRGKRGNRVNFYHKLLNGGFSIKKVLPLFSDLTYKDLEIQNGIGAIVAYSKFKYLPQEDILELRKNLIKYCGLDTYSMFVILNNIKKETGYGQEKEQKSL